MRTRTHHQKRSPASCLAGLALCPFMRYEIGTTPIQEHHG